MERESGVLEPKAQNESRSKFQTALRVMGMFLAGLWFSAVFGELLMEKRMPHSHWTVLLFLTISIVTLIPFFRKDESKGAGQMLWFAFCICLLPIYFLRAHDWAPIATGALLAALFWAMSKSTGRSYPFLPACALLAGILSLRVPWPNGQRCMLTFVGVGLAMSLQGIWIIIRYLQGDRSAIHSISSDAPQKTQLKADMQFLDLVTGTIGHVQIISPELEQRIRLRYQSEIYQLKVLEFDYQFSDGETVSIFRLALIFPALVMLMMWRKREIITIHDGRYFLVGHPVYVSKNKIAFAEPCGLGTKFYTAFQDGMILISKNYGESLGLRPIVIENTCTGASITDTWFSHQKQIEALEAEGKRVDRQTSFEFYSEIERKETTLT